MSDQTDPQVSPAGRRYGWKPDLPDPNRRYYEPPQALMASLPPRGDILQYLPEAWDQGDLGSCGGQGVAGIIAGERAAQKLPYITPSRLMIYYLARELEGSVNSDVGMSISDGLKVVHRHGYCDESLWPYDVRRFKERPPAAALEAARPNRVTDYMAVRHAADDIKGCVAAGDGVVFGFIVFESFESDQVRSTGVMPIPRKRERKRGGHCVFVAGYDDAKGAYLCRNSWGKRWGQDGNFWMPYEYAHSGYSSDFWVVKSVPGGTPAPAPDPDPDGPVPTPGPGPGAKTRRLIIDLDSDGPIGNARVVFAK